jgi:hypothetical protein
LDGDLTDFEEAWELFTWMEATDWKILPNAGGLQDQEKILMDNIFKIAAFVQKVKKAAKKDGR